MAECQKFAGLVMVRTILCGDRCSAILLFDKGFSIKKTHSATKYAYEKNAPKGTIQINNKVEGISC